MYDPATDRDAWSLTFPHGTLWTPVEGADLAFLEPNGTLHVVDDQTGQERWKTSLPAQSLPATEFTVHADADRFYVHTAHEKSAEQEQMIRPIGGEVHVNGLVATLDRHSGQLLWSRPLEQQLFHPHLPVKSGVLVYAAQRLRVTPDKKEENYTSIVFLNRSTGEPVLSQEVQGLSTTEGWSSSPEGLKWLRVRGQDFQLKRKTDSETDSEAQAPEQDEPQPGTTPAAP